MTLVVPLLSTSSLHLPSSHPLPFIMPSCLTCLPPLCLLSSTWPHSKQPWIDLFDGGRSLAPRWKTLFVKYPDRFILNFDNVWADDWGDRYVSQAALWRKA